MKNKSEIIETIKLDSAFLEIELVDFKNIKNFFTYFEKLILQTKKWLASESSQNLLTSNMCEKHGLPFNYYVKWYGDKFCCPKDKIIQMGIFYIDYKYTLLFKIEQIYRNIKNAEEDIKNKFYPLIIKYYNNLEGNRKKRFEKNYKSIQERINILKRYINQCVDGYKNNKIGLIYFLYYFPEIIINKFNLDDKNIDEDIYISKLSSYFSSYKWITIQRKFLTIKDENNIKEKMFDILIEKKIDIDNNNELYKDLVYYENGRYMKIKDDLIAYIDEKNKEIYYRPYDYEFDYDNNLDELIILAYKEKNAYGISKRKLMLKKVNEDDDDDKNYIIFGKKINLGNMRLDLINIFAHFQLKIYNNYIYIFTNIFIIILTKDLECYKIIKLTGDINISKLNLIYKINDYVFILRREPNSTIIFNIQQNEIVSYTFGLSGQYIFELKKSKNILIQDYDKIMLYNYKIGKLVDVQYFHELYIKDDKNKKDIFDEKNEYSEEKFKLVYKNIVIGKVNILKLKYLLDNFKDIKYDFILNEDNYMINLKNK